MAAASNPVRIVGLTGRARAGKSTVAAYLERQYGYGRLRLSGPLKDMLRSIGLTDRHIEGDLKDLPCDLLCGKSPRFAMLKLGTEWRNMIGTRLWSNIWSVRARKLLNGGPPIVTEDVRFPHEVEAIRAAGGIIVNVFNPRLPVRKWWQFWKPRPHASERYDFPFDVQLVNDGDFDHLYNQVDYRLMRALPVIALPLAA